MNLEIKAGKHYRTRSGQRAFVGFVVPPSRGTYYCVVGYIDCVLDDVADRVPGDAAAVCWSLEGVASSGVNGLLDLVGEWHPFIKGDGWATVCKKDGTIKVKDLSLDFDASPAPFDEIYDCIPITWATKIP